MSISSFASKPVILFSSLSVCLSFSVCETVSKLDYWSIGPSMPPLDRGSFHWSVHRLANQSVSLLIGHLVPVQCVLTRNSVFHLVLWSVSQTLHQSVNQVIAHSQSVYWVVLSSFPHISDSFAYQLVGHSVCLSVCLSVCQSVKEAVRQSSDQLVNQSVKYSLHGSATQSVSPSDNLLLQ